MTHRVGGAYNSLQMEGRAKVTKEVLCEEARFILANVMAEARYGRQNRYDDIRRVCEGAVSIPFAEYVGFLEKSGYLRHDNENLEVTPEGDIVWEYVNPYFGGPPKAQTNQVFRAYRYTAEEIERAQKAT